MSDCSGYTDLAEEAKRVASGYAPDVVQAAFDVADGNDGVNWKLLESNCPVGMKIGHFIDTLVGAV